MFAKTLSFTLSSKHGRFGNPSGETVTVFERREGVHFLTDFYALFGLKRFESEPNRIKRAHRKFMMLHNVDRHRGLTGEKKAEHMTRLGNLAYETLSRTDKKQEYDKRLAQWQGPISEDGTPVVHVTDPFWSVHGPLASGPAISIPDESQEAHALAQSGHNANLLDYLRETHASSGRATLLYLQELRKRVDYWRWRIEMRRVSGGLAMPELSGGMATPQLKAIQAAERQQAETAWQELKLAIEAGAIKALPAGSSKVPSKELQIRHTQALQRFTATTTAALEFAKQHDAALAELTTPLYVPKQEQFFTNVVVVLQVNGSPMRFAFRFDGKRVDQVEDLDDAQLEALDAPDKAARLIAAGWNIVYVCAPKSSDSIDAINSTLQAHYDKLRQKR